MFCTYTNLCDASEFNDENKFCLSVFIVTLNYIKLYNLSKLMLTQYI